MLILAALHLTRFLLGLTLPELPLTVPIWYIPLSGAIWGMGSLAAAIGLFLGHTWAPSVVRWGALLFSLWFWIDRLFLVVSDYGLRTRTVSLVLNVLAVVILFWVLSRSKVRRYFRELEG